MPHAISAQVLFVGQSEAFSCHNVIGADLKDQRTCSFVSDREVLRKVLTAGPIVQLLATQSDPVDYDEVIRTIVNLRARLSRWDNAVPLLVHVQHLEFVFVPVLAQPLITVSQRTVAHVSFDANGIV